MKKIFFLMCFCSGITVFAQSSEQKLLHNMKTFHQTLVSGNTDSIGLFLMKEATYGHSNGWVETHDDVLKHLREGKIDYNSFKEDSIQTVLTGKQAQIRFIADIGATLDGKAAMYHLKVLEVWVKDGKRWKLFARQAVKA